MVAIALSTHSVVHESPPNGTVFQTMARRALRVEEDPNSQALVSSELSAILHNQSVAILLLGDAFRSLADNYTPCDVRSVEAQREATESHLNNIVRPLARLGARVEVVLTFPRCRTAELTQRLRDRLVGWLSPWVSRVWTIRSRSMDDGWRKAYRVLQTRTRLSRDGEPFDFVLQARHDVLIERPIDTWPADFRRMLFEQECVLSCKGCVCGTTQPRFLPACLRGRCVKDHLMWTPRKHMPLVYDLMQRSFSAVGGAYAHQFNLHMLRTGRIQGDEIGYMFPPECSRPGSFGSAFQTLLMCNQYAAYRPSRGQSHGRVALPRDDADELR